RVLQLPQEYLGKEVQCPSCEASFIAGAANPQPKIEPSPEAISAEPTPAPLPAESAPDLKRPRYRRPRHLDVDKAPKPRKNVAGPVILVGVIVVAVIGCLVVMGLSRQGRREFQPIANAPPAVKMPPPVGREPPFAEVPDRIMADEEQL